MKLLTNKQTKKNAIVNHVYNVIFGRLMKSPLVYSFKIKSDFIGQDAYSMDIRFDEVSSMVHDRLVFSDRKLFNLFDIIPLSSDEENEEEFFPWMDDDAIPTTARIVQGDQIRTSQLFKEMNDAIRTYNTFIIWDNFRIAMRTMCNQKMNIENFFITKFNEDEIDDLINSVFLLNHVEIDI